MANILGISAGFHDAALSVIDSDGNILFAGHSERFSKKKHDSELCPEIIEAAKSYGPIETIAYYEKPLLKQMRRLYSGEGFDFKQCTTKQVVKQLLGEHLDFSCKIESHGHHESHAAAGFQTSPFDHATVVVIDAIGEWDSISIWAAQSEDPFSGKVWYDQIWGQTYPHSIGLFYSAMTKRVGLRPLDEEYILMGMAAYGEPSKLSKAIKDALVKDESEGKMTANLHAGIDDTFLEGEDEYDIAAGSQAVVEDLIMSIIERAKDYKWSKNLVFMGGVALNCSANRKLGEYFDNIWIMPNPGDAGSSLGAAALSYGRMLTWKDAYLGTEIPGEYPVADVVSELKTNKIVGVASGRAEFGPRALGNRSLLADPRGPEIKDKVNEIKRRQKFRPFAPVILEEYVDEYFDMPNGFPTSDYMQVTAPCIRPDEFPAIIHADGTSRVQTVPKGNTGIRKLLEAWYKETGCPMLLNTSLNIRGEPMVDDRTDADRFEEQYGVKVCS